MKGYDIKTFDKKLNKLLKMQLTQTEQEIIDKQLNDILMQFIKREKWVDDKFAKRIIKKHKYSIRILEYKYLTIFKNKNVVSQRILWQN